MSRPTAALGLAVVLAALTACATSVPIRYHTLAAADGPPAGTGGPRLVVALEPVDLANYLDRSEIVTRRGPTALRISENARWGEPFDILVGRIFAQNLAAADPRLEVVQMPTAFTVEPDRQLVVEIDRFEADEQGVVVLEARWQTVASSGRARPVGGRLRLTENAGAIGADPDYDAIAAAMSRALTGLAGAIAAGLR